MKDETKKRIHILARETGKKCAQCTHSSEYRCCDPFFCELAEITMNNLGYDHPVTDHPTMKYMGPEGCVLPPHYRPQCSGYVCKSHFTDKVFYKNYRKFNRLIFNDPQIKKACKDASEICKAIFKRL